MKFSIRWIILSIVFLISSFNLATAQRKRVHWSELDNNRGKIYHRNHIEPFTGIAFDEYSPGQKKGEIRFKEGLMNGKAIQWDRDGNKISETNYVNNKKEGRETIWYANGNKQVEVNYINDQPHGMVVEYFDTGEKMSAGELVNGVENGRYTWWFKNGQKDQELSYNMGVVNGTVTNWYPDGQYKMIANYKSGKKQGTTTYWFEGGDKMSIQHYQMDTEIDTSSFWHKDGRLKEQKIYNRSGTLVQHRSFEEASILTPTGYWHVFNKLGSNFILDIKGKKVEPIDAKVLAFYVDGELVQLFTTPKKDFTTGADNELEILKNFKEYDVDRLEALLSDDSLTVELDLKTETIPLQNGSSALFWSFRSPGESASKKLTLIEEQFLVIICQNHILMLNGLVFKANDPKSMKAKLTQLANQVTLKDQPIDVIELSKQFK